MLRLMGVSGGYGARTVLYEVDAEFGPGLHVILGPNGSGKTTLFRIAAGILPPRRGRVELMGTDPHRHPEVKRHLAYVGHRPALQPGLSVRDNLEFWARVLGLGPGQRRAAVDRALELADLAHLAERRAGTLSRGQAQRAGVARAFLGDPRVLFLDEPTTGMDPEAAHRMRRLLREWAAGGRTVLYSSHNLYEASEVADHVTLLRGGRVVARGTPDELRQRFPSPWRLALRVRGDPLPVLARLGVAAARDGPRWLLEVPPGMGLAAIVGALGESGCHVEEVREVGSPLEAVYLALVDDGGPAQP